MVLLLKNHLMTTIVLCDSIQGGIGSAHNFHLFKMSFDRPERLDWEKNPIGAEF